MSAASVAMNLVAPATIERFWFNVRKGPDCWDWTGKTNGHGYGRLYVDGRMVPAHRLSWEIHNGPIPPGMLACHHCDRPICVAPLHIFLGTHADNMADAISKGRTKHGFVDGLTKRQREILDFIAESIAARGCAPTIREMCIHFGISSTNGIADHLKSLKRKGLLVSEPGKSRTLRLVESG